MSTEYTAAMAHSAVARGAAWLDEKCPDWIAEIDTEALDLAKPDVCVLGQTANCLIGPASGTYKSRDGEYWRVLDSLRLGPFSSWQREHGFDVPYNRADAAEYEMLTIAWREYIRERLEAVS